MTNAVERPVMIIRAGALLALAVGIALALWYYDWPTCSGIQSSIRSMGWHASLCFVVLYILATVFFVPGAILTVISGLVFGPWWGTFYVMIGAVIGVSAAFLISRYLAYGLVRRIVVERRWFVTFERSLGRNGFFVTLLVRLVPIFPYNGLNYACGILPLRLRDYALGSFLGMLPGAFTYVYLGSLFGCAFFGQDIHLSGEGKAIIAGLIVIRIVLGGGALIFLKRRIGTPKS